MQKTSEGKKAPWPALAAGALAGAAAGLFGSGGGTVLVPCFTGLCGLPQKKALASSVAVTLVLSLLSVLVYGFRGSLPLLEALPYAAGGLLGGLLAGKVLGKLPAALLRRVFGLFLLWGGLRGLL